MPTFCRHGRLEATCPICARKAREGQAAEPRRATPRPARSSSGRSPSARGGGDLRVRRMARAADDGYEHELLPGLRSSVDAGRLADEMAFSAARLDELATDPPGLYAEVAGAADVEEATGWPSSSRTSHRSRARTRGRRSRCAHAAGPRGELPMLEDVALGPRAAHDPARGASTLLAYRAWAERAGSQAQAFTGDPAWSDPRRFDRAFERLSLPGFGRAARFDLLVTLGRLGVYAVARGRCSCGRPARSDGGRLQARARHRRPDAAAAQGGRLVGAVDVPIEALDLALTNWSRPEGERIRAGATVGVPAPLRERVGATLGGLALTRWVAPSSPRWSMYCTSAVMRAASARRLRSSSRSRANFSASDPISVPVRGSRSAGTATSSFMTQGSLIAMCAVRRIMADRWRDAAAAGSFCSASADQATARALADRLVKGSKRSRWRPPVPQNLQTSRTFAPLFVAEALIRSWGSSMKWGGCGPTSPTCSRR